MRICFILSSLYLSGGVRVVIQYANQMTRRGHQVTLIVPNGTVDAQIFQEIDPIIKIIKTKSTLDKNTNKIKLLPICWEMATSIPKSDVIVATHTPTTAVSFIAAKLLNKGKIIWFYQDYQEMFDGRPIEKWLLCNAFRWHDVALTVSEACVQELRSFFPGRVINIGEGIDNNIFHPHVDENQISYGSHDKKEILFIGDSRPRKGLIDFICASEKVYAKEPNLVITIASKENLTIQTSIPHNLILRPKDDDLARLYCGCDIFVSASWYEGFGLPPLEAMACGAAVVTTDSRGIREYAVNGENCLIVPPRNPEALAEAILLLLSNSELTDKLRKNGPITALRFDWESATDRLEAALLIVNTQSHSS